MIPRRGERGHEARHVLFTRRAFPSTVCSLSLKFMLVLERRSTRGDQRAFVAKSIYLRVKYVSPNLCASR